MKNKFKMSKKSASVGVVICFVVVIALTGISTFNNYQKKLENQLTKDLVSAKEKMEERISDVQETNNSEVQNEEPKEEPNTEVKDTQETSNSQVIPQINDPYFTKEDTLVWPVDGNVLMNYSMDQTVYFATLDQYKYNPAVIIEGEVGMEVISAASGIVKSVDVTAQTGTTVTVDLGNGYEAVYGQLKEVAIEPGTYVAKGGLIGYLSEPSKYYVVEGCNLYFQLIKDGESVNPLEYLEYE